MTKTHLKILVVALFVFVILLLAISLYLSPPQFIRERNLPPYAKELPAPFDEASREFDRRVKEQFLLPMEESQLVELLSSQNYKVDGVAKHASLSNSSFPCLYMWQVIWNTDANSSITKITGQYTRTCL